MLIYTECCNEIYNMQLWKYILNDMLNILVFMIIIGIPKHVIVTKKISYLQFFVELSGGN